MKIKRAAFIFGLAASALVAIVPAGSVEAKPQQVTVPSVVVFNRYVHGQIGWTY